MTFNDFVHGIFTENIPCIQASDMDSVIASLHLLDPQEADKTSLLLAMFLSSTLRMSSEMFFLSMSRMMRSPFPA